MSHAIDHPYAVFPEADASVLEQEIRRMANSIVNGDFTRRHHPTYGVTKTNLRSALAFMNGMVGLYGVITAQTSNATLTAPVRFNSPRTTDIVARAREIVGNL